MPRQIAYDPEKLKQDIMTLFWAQGYEETSLSDLEAATGLNRRQLYNGVGDKHEMFLGAMDDFATMSGQSFLAALESETAKVADIEALFALFVEMSHQTEGPKGCLICSTSQDPIARDAAVSARMNAFFDRIRAAHMNVLERALERKEIALDQSTLEKRADALFGAHVALCILGRAGRPEAQLKRIAAQALEGLT